MDDSTQVPESAKSAVVGEAVSLAVVWFGWPFLAYLVGWLFLPILSLSFVVIARYISSLRKEAEQDEDFDLLRFRRYSQKVFRRLFYVIGIPQIILAVSNNTVGAWVFLAIALVVGGALLFHGYLEIQELEKESNPESNPES